MSFYRETDIHCKETSSGSHYQINLLRITQFVPGIGVDWIVIMSCLFTTIIQHAIYRYSNFLSLKMLTT